MHDALQCDPGAFPDLARAQARSRRTLTDYIEDLVAEGSLQGDPQVLGHIFWATTHGLLSLQLAGRLDSRPDFDTLYRTAMRMLARGAATDAAPDYHEKPARQPAPAGTPTDGKSVGKGKRRAGRVNIGWSP